MTLDTSECSALFMLSDYPIRCVTGLSGLSLNCHRDRKVSRELVHNMKCAVLHNILIPSYFLSVNLPFSPDYRLVIICSNEDEGKSGITSKLKFYWRPYSALPSDASFAEFLLGHFRRWPESAYTKRLSRATAASVVDCDK